MKKLLLALLLISFPAYAQKISNLTDTSVASPSAVLPMNEGSTTYKGKISDQVWLDIKAKNGKTAAAFCDGTSHLASASYASLGALQTDYSNATALTQEMDGIVIEWMMSNNKAFYIPEGTCLINFESSLTSKTWYAKSHPLGIIKGSGSSELEEMFTCSACNVYTVGLNMDGENKFRNHFYMNNPGEMYFEDYEGYDLGWPVTQATNLVSSLWFNGTMASPIIINKSKFSDVVAVGDGTYGNNIGGARLGITLTPSASQKPIVKIIDWTSDATGSVAEELDHFNQNVNAVYGSWLTFVNPIGYYNGESRRWIKVHSGDATIYNPLLLKASDFVTAPTAAGNTSVGAENLAAVDFAGSGQGSITMYGGSIDWSGFPTGFTSSSSSSDSHINAYGTEFIGGIYWTDRNHPETGTPGTGASIAFATGSSDRGSGCDGCYFKDGYVGMQLRGYQSFIRNSFFDDPIAYPIWINPASSARTGMMVENNTIVTRTVSRLKNDTSGASLSRIFPVQVATDYVIRNNKLVQDGNTDHQGVLIDELTASVGGVVAFNAAPATYTSGAFTIHRKLSAATSKVVANNYSMESVLEVNTTAVGNVGTGTDNLQTYSVLANNLSAAGQGIVIKFSATYANNANAKTFTYDIGGTDVVSLTLTTSQAGVIEGECYLFRTGASTQLYSCSGNFTGAAAAMTSFATNGTLALTDTSAITVKGEGNATSNDDISMKFHYIKKVN